MKLHRAKVGDRYVMEMMKQENSLAGGESSGHVICLDKTTTGDGIVAALQVLAEIQATGHTLHELRSAMTKYPQKLINLRVNQMIDISSNVEIRAAVKAAETELGDEGRVLLRASGTEPVIRVMVEGRDATLTNHLAKQLAETISAILD
jgi:phosphoglucosamine mutase